MFAGVAMTNLPGILVLALAKAQLIQIFFFRLNLIITLLGMAHGLVFLPVLLSYFGTYFIGSFVCLHQRGVKSFLWFFFVVVVVVMSPFLRSRREQSSAAAAPAGEREGQAGARDEEQSETSVWEHKLWRHGDKTGARLELHGALQTRRRAFKNERKRSGGERGENWPFLNTDDKTAVMSKYLCNKLNMGGHRKGQV